MNKEVAHFLLRSLLDRIEQGSIGTVSSVEKIALEFALHNLADVITQPMPIEPALPSAAGVMASQAHETAIEELDSIQQRQLKPVDLVLDSLMHSASDEEELIMCLDFGTAMSKAFAMGEDNIFFEIKLGERAGYSGYAVPSSVFITDDGKILFGQEAVEESQELLEAGRQRLDSIKSFLSLRSDGDLDSDACVLKAEFNPIRDIKITEGDLIRIYLAYLTDLATSEFASHRLGDDQLTRYVPRRFAHPCWNAQQKVWAERQMRTWLAEAQILADTFHGRWQHGLDIGEVKFALDQVKRLPKLPTYLIKEGVPEPVAAAAGAVADGTDKREAFAVIDVGAGTTDFGVFVIREIEETAFSRVFQVPKTIHALMQAGDKVDLMLKKFILDAESIDVNDNHGRLLAADLTRRIRGLKERIFDDGTVTYVLADSTMGTINLEEFMSSRQVKQFQQLIERGFTDALERMDDSWLDWISNVGLKVVLTGGGANLPMIRNLASGVIKIRGRKIVRDLIDPVPGWIRFEAEAIEPVFNQLAVAIGGAEPQLPETIIGPEVFSGGNARTQYVAGSFQITGN